MPSDSRDIPSKELAQKKSALLLGFEQVRLSHYEAQIVGEMLVAIFQTEETLDELLGTYFSPIVSNRRDALVDRLILFAPLGKKLDAVLELGILEEKVIKRFRAIADRRNALAHRRSDAERIGRTITNQQKQQFVKECNHISRDILDASKNALQKLIQGQRDEWIQIIEEYVKSQPTKS